MYLCVYGKVSTTSEFWHDDKGCTCVDTKSMLSVHKKVSGGYIEIVCSNVKYTVILCMYAYIHIIN